MTLRRQSSAGELLRDCGTGQENEHRDGSCAGGVRARAQASGRAQRARAQAATHRFLKAPDGGTSAISSISLGAVRLEHAPPLPERGFKV